MLGRLKLFEMYSADNRPDKPEKIEKKEKLKTK